VIQDDTLPCANFSATLERVVCEVPVCLFLSRLPRRISAATLRTKGRYLDTQLRINEFMPVVAVLWPIAKAQEFMAWTQANPHRLGHRAPRSDDSVAGRWAALTKQTIRFTIPSLVEHRAEEESVKGDRTPASSLTAFSFLQDGNEW
jgi:hypothetical protein